ncbi:MAG: AI-2E family transporter [Bacteroidaceae bacterium]|nr:AI-2E family transporter [Bacteroidaceae bacterium]
MKTKTFTFDRVVRILISIVIMVAGYFLILRLSSVLIPFLVAWLIAYLLYPIVTFFQYKCHVKSRVVSIIITVLLIVGIIIGGCYLIIPPIIEEIGHLKDIIVEYVSTDSTVESISSEVQNFIKHNIDLNEITQALTVKDVSEFVEEKVPQFFSFISSSVSAIVGFIASLIAIIYLFFILVDYELMAEGLFKLMPKERRDIVHEIMQDLQKGMNSYFRGQTIIAMCVGVLFAIGFLIIDFPLAIPLGLFIGFLNLVPYLQVIGFIPTIVLALLKAYDTGQSFWGIILAALIVFCVVQAIQDWVLTPRIMGKVTGLNAAVILLSLSIWGSLLGFVGLIVALPLTTLLVSYYKRYVLEEYDEKEVEHPAENK